MNIQGFGDIFAPPLSEINSINSEVHREAITSEEYDVIATINKTVRISEKERSIKLNKLSNYDKTTVKRTVEFLSFLEERFLDIQKLNLQIEELDSESGTDEDEIDALESQRTELVKKLMCNITSHLKELKKIGFVNDVVSTIWRLEYKKSTLCTHFLNFYREQVLNSLLNFLIFKKETINFINKNVDKILIELFQFKPLKIGENNFSVNLEFVTQESHNGGRRPVKVNIFEKDVLRFEFFFKPRDARIDLEVINTFKRLNSLSNKEKSLLVDLPVYKIINFEEISGFFSIWNYLEGQSIETSDTEKGLLSMVRENEKEIIKKQLMRLDSVCGYLKISDLHGSNVLLCKPGTELKVVPIDLESIQRNGVTGLFRRRVQHGPFSKKELAILENSSLAINSLPFRFIPINTSHFLSGLANFESYAKVAKNIISEIENSGFKITVEKENINFLVLMDFVNNDVPYLIEYKNEIYYGKIDKEHQIARKRGLS